MQRTWLPRVAKFLALSFPFFVFIFAIACTTKSSERRPITPSTNKQGVHLLLDDGRSHWPISVWRSHMEHAAQLIGPHGYVTQLIRLDDLNINKWQQFMDLCADFDLIPIIRLATVYDQQADWWEAPPRDDNGRYTTVASQYATFLASLTWPTDQHFILVGNEPNHGDEWGGRPDPAAYAQFLTDVSTAIKTADPQARILNAPLDPFSPHTGSQPFNNGFWYVDATTFLQEMYKTNPTVFNHIDAWASHPYPLGPFAAPPWQQTFQIDSLNGAPHPSLPNPLPELPNRGINGYEWELWQLAQWGIRDLPLFITETGWRHSEKGYPTVAEVTVYFDLALRGNNGRYPQYPETGWTPWLADSRIIAITPFALNGHPDEWNHTNWLQMDSDGTILDIQITP